MKLTYFIEPPPLQKFDWKEREIPWRTLARIVRIDGFRYPGYPYLQAQSFVRSSPRSKGIPWKGRELRLNDTVTENDRYTASRGRGGTVGAADIATASDTNLRSTGSPLPPSPLSRFFLSRPPANMPTCQHTLHSINSVTSPNACLMTRKSNFAHPRPRSCETRPGGGGGRTTTTSTGGGGGGGILEFSLRAIFFFGMDLDRFSFQDYLYLPLSISSISNSISFFVSSFFRNFFRDYKFCAILFLV